MRDIHIHVYIMYLYNETVYDACAQGITQIDEEIPESIRFYRVYSWGGRVCYLLAHVYVWKSSSLMKHKHSISLSNIGHSTSIYVVCTHTAIL